MATNRQWIAEVNLDQYIANIRSDVERVEDRLKTARQREQEGSWTSARRIYLELMANYPDSDLVKSIRMPVEITTIPRGASIVLDGEDASDPSPSFVRVDPFRETVVTLKKKNFQERSFTLGPFGQSTDPAKYRYPESLLKAPMWKRNVRDHKRARSSPPRSSTPSRA
jgi:hypothetical protein